MKRVLTGLALLAAAALVLAVAGGAATLPGGSSIDAAVTFPHNGDVLPAAPFTATGTASVGTGQAVANTTLVYIVDVSNSTSSPTGGTACPNQGAYDLTGNTTLDCELLAVRDLNDTAITNGTVAKIAMIGFAGSGGSDTLTNIRSAATLDLGPATGDQLLVAPNQADFGGFPTHPPAVTPHDDLDWVLSSAYVAGNSGSPLAGWPSRAGVTDGFSVFTPHDLGTTTNYYAALTKLHDLIPSITTPHTEVVFLSDGLPNETVSGQQLATILSQLHPTTTSLSIDTFAVTGSGSTCGSPTPSLNGSLAQIAAAYGKACHPLANPEDATSAVPDVIAAKLTGGSLTVDGNPTPTAVGATLPATGPVTASLTSGSLNLPAGSHTICASATGADGGGNGSDGPNCVTFTIKDAPTVTIVGGDDSTGIAGTRDEGSSFPVSATAAGGTFTSATWSSDAPSHCTFADPSSLSTTVTCDDDGVYALTITLHDGVNPDATATEHLRVVNVAPTAALSVSPAAVGLNAPAVHAHVAITDPGADSWSCVISWGDGVTDTVAASGKACDADHSYATAGTFPVSVLVSDDDGGTGTDSGSATVVAPPTIIGLPTDGTNGSAGSTVEGSPFAIGGSVPAGVNVSVAAVLGSPGHCTIATPTSLPTSLTCDDNGTAAVTVTATDGFGQVSTSVFHVVVTNADPSLTISSPVAGGSLRTVTFTALVSDPGANDTLTCSIDWGDGSAVETVAIGSSSGTCNSSHTYAASVVSAVVTAWVTDDDGGSSAHKTVALTFNRPPVCTDVRALGVAGLWPPNHKLVLITLTGATDPDAGTTLTYTIVGVTQDEPITGGGSGNTAFDAQRASGGSVYLRSERAGTGDGRVYTIAYTVSDGSLSCGGTIDVAVPHDAAHDAVKSPQSYNSLG